MPVNRREVPLTAGGSLASRIGPAEQLKRLVMTYMLWEKGFYINGQDVNGMIQKLVPIVDAKTVAEIAIEARDKQKLRHVPLYIVREMARHESHKPYVAMTLAHVVQRADELAEFLALYWASNGNYPAGHRKAGQPNKSIAHCVKRGLSKAFVKFNGYDLAKWDKTDAAIKLRDVMFLVNPKPKDQAQEAIFKKLAENALEAPDTWEVELIRGQGKDKTQSWTRLIEEKKLGALAFLRNVRNIQEAGVDTQLVVNALRAVKVDRVLPFQFITAYRYANATYKPIVEELMLKCLSGMEKLPGHTVVVLDVSGSMSGKLSAQSELSRIDVASSLAMLLKEVCEEVSIYATAGSDPNRTHKTARLDDNAKGFQLQKTVEKAAQTLGGGGIFLVQCMDAVYEDLAKRGFQGAARTIVLTDEQDCSGRQYDPATANAFGFRNYILNISHEKNGIAYNKFTHINGFSEHTISFIRELEDGQTVAAGVTEPLSQMSIAD